MFPYPISRKNTICWLYQWTALQIIRFSLPMRKFYFSFYQFFCINENNIQCIIFDNIFLNSFASGLLVLWLFLTHSCFFFILHQVVGKPFKFINNSLQTIEIFLNESNFPSFLSLCIFILVHHLGKCANNFCINNNINVY